MLMIKTLSTRTDEHGFLHATESFSPPGPFGFKVNIFATLKSPAGLGINGKVELDTAGGAPQSKQFVASTGDRISLGTWHIAHGNNVIIVSGRTSPISANSDLTLDVEADLALF